MSVQLTDFRSGRCSEHLRCCACGGKRLHVFGQKNGFVLHRCRDCRCISTKPPQKNAYTQELYEHYYDRASFRISPAAKQSLNDLVTGMDAVRTNGRWLDFGYGEGGLLSVAEDYGWRCHGVELSTRALNYGQERGWTVTPCPEDDHRFREKFDVVTMLEVLEHVDDPAATLKRVSMWLRPGGIFFATTPNAESLNRRVLGINWSIIAPPEHVTIWTASGLRAALVDAGMRAWRIRTGGLNPAELIRRIRRTGRPSTATQRNQVAFSLNETFNKSATRRNAKRLINCCLSVFRLGDTLKMWAVKMGHSE